MKARSNSLSRCRIPARWFAAFVIEHSAHRKPAGMADIRGLAPKPRGPLGFAQLDYRAARAAIAVRFGRLSQYLRGNSLIPMIISLFLESISLGEAIQGQPVIRLSVN